MFLIISYSIPLDQSGVTIMMQLRKVANHHLLHRYNYDVAKLRKMAKAILKVSFMCVAETYSVDL